MDGRGDSGAVRLKGAGIGTIVGGAVLGALSVLLPYAAASAIVLGVGVALWQFDYPGQRVGVDLGVSAVGAIGTFEALLGGGIGIGPFLLAGLAIGIGLLDVVAGTVFERLRTR